MRVIGVNYVLSIATVETSDRGQRFDSSQKQRDKDDVEPHCRQHQGPERDLPLARLDQSCETEVSGDHRVTSFELQRGHGRPASSHPITTTNRIKPRMNCMFPPT